MFLNVVIDRLRWLSSRGRAVKSVKVRFAVPFVLYVISSQYNLAQPIKCFIKNSATWPTETL